MKKLALIALIFVGYNSIIWSNSIDSMESGADTLLWIQVDSLHFRDSITSKNDTLLWEEINKIINPQVYCKGAVEDWEWLFVFSPLILLLIFTILFWLGLNSKESDDGKVKKSKREGIFTMMLMEKDDANAHIIPSKFIAFSSGMTAIFIALVVLTFYAYMIAAQCNNHLNIEGLWKLVVALGIGVVPYGYYIFLKNR